MINTAPVLKASMKKIYYTISFIFISSIGFTNTLDFEPIESKTKSIIIQIIPKLELFHIMAYLSNSSHLNNFEFKYKSEIDSFFEPFRNQNEVLFVNKVLHNYHSHLLINGLFVNNNFKKDSSSVSFLNVDDFGLEDNYFNKVLILDSLTKTIDSFAKTSNFNKFIDSHETYYKQKISEVKDAISNVEIKKYNETFWGSQKDNYQFVICLLEQDIHSYWFNYENKLYSVFFLSPKFIVDNDAQFGNANKSDLKEGKISVQDYIFYGAAHELGHCFLNPIVDRYKVEIDKINFIISTSDPSKSIFLCESLLRSLTAYFMIENNYADVAQMVLQMEKQSGYIYNDLILELIEDYGVNRAIYKNFNDYMPILITKLNQQIK
jgi:hypothetical protein